MTESHKRSLCVALKAYVPEKTLRTESMTRYGSIVSIIALLLIS